MTILILGLIILLGMHSLTMFRDTRAGLVARLGEGPYMRYYSLVSLVGLALIAYGFGAYRASGYIQIWNPPVWTRHIALLLMLPAMILLVSAYTKGRIKRTVRHPMLVAVKIWALAHLLANGDLGSIVLFGLFLAYAVVDRIAIKRRGEVTEEHGAVGSNSATGDIVAVVGGLLVYAAFVMWLHPLLIGVPVISR
jgi:uncharacterized membrane protein